MKNVGILLCISLALISCKNERVDVRDIAHALSRAQKACGLTSLPWLEEMLIKAEEDRTLQAHQGQYVGSISLVKHQGTSLFYTNFGLGSGGIAYYVFDCQGNPVLLTGDVGTKILDEVTKQENILYSTIDPR